MHEMEVVQPLSAIARTKSPKPFSSASVHSVFVMRQRPGGTIAWTIGGAGAATGGAATVACDGMFLVAVQPHNATPSAAIKSSRFTFRPPIPSPILTANNAERQTKNT